MFRFYLNRELSDRLGFKLSRWKRWSREFLPPDPLGGLQSGFARQYSPAEAFQVYLGGHLVSNIKCSIPEAKKILEDLKEWISAQYFSYQSVEDPPLVQPSAKEYRIYIFMNIDPMQVVQPHHYLVRRVIDEEISRGKGARIVTERYIENWLKEGETLSLLERQEALPHWMAAKILYITKVYQIFTERLKEEGK
jgi:hypothetical protein